MLGSTGNFREAREGEGSDAEEATRELQLLRIGAFLRQKGSMPTFPNNPPRSKTHAERREELYLVALAAHLTLWGAAAGHTVLGPPKALGRTDGREAPRLQARNASVGITSVRLLAYPRA